MTDYYLKFTTEQAAKDALAVAGYMSDGEIITASHEHALDMVGAVEELTGYFVNIRTEYLPKTLWSFLIKPSKFYRAWADTPDKMTEQETKCLAVIAEVKEKAVKIKEIKEI